jgi:hypothetical protein
MGAASALPTYPTMPHILGRKGYIDRRRTQGHQDEAMSSIGWFNDYAYVSWMEDVNRDS